MKKRAILLLTVVCVLLSVCACGKKKEETTEAEKTENPVIADCASFVNEKLPAISKDRDEAVALYNEGFTGDSVDPQKVLSSLKNTAIPKMEIYINALSAIETTTDEVTQLKDCYLRSAQKQYEAMKMVVSAIEGENSDYLMQADNLISEADKLLAEFDTKLADIVKANGMVMKSTSSDAQ